MAERELQKQVVEYLRKLGIFHFAITPPDKKRMVFGTKYYLPDIYCLINGVSVFLELKAPEYKSAHPERQAKQELIRQEIIANGGRAYRITSLDELIEVL